jgi:hypothetical protein
MTGSKALCVQLSVFSEADSEKLDSQGLKNVSELIQSKKRMRRLKNQKRY